MNNLIVMKSRMLNFSSVMIGAADAKILGDYYSKVFGKAADMADEENGWWVWTLGSAAVMVGRHSEVKGKSVNPERIILNFDTKEVQSEFDRIKAIDGTVVIKEPYSMGEGHLVATLTDPEGNYFQIATPWNN